jgi:ATP-dependent DNA ligase
MKSSTTGSDIARKDGARMRLCSRLRSRSCIIDGEAGACDECGIASFDLIRYRRNDTCVFLYAFDLIELNGDDLRRDPLVVRKTTLVSGGRERRIISREAGVRRGL